MKGPAVLERILDRLAELMVSKLVDHTDEIAAAVAKEVMSQITPLLPDLHDLDDQIMSKIPDFSKLLSGSPFLGGR